MSPTENAKALNPVYPRIFSLGPLFHRIQWTIQEGGSYGAPALPYPLTLPELRATANAIYAYLDELEEPCEPDSKS